jgi:cell division protein FtsZ
MREMGKAMMGTGEASGDKRALRSAEAAISNPLMDDVSLRGARGLLISFHISEIENRVLRLARWAAD